jgi:hypothetical protein
MGDDKPAKETSSAETDDPNESTKGLLDEDELREHAREVDVAIQEAKNRNP